MFNLIVKDPRRKPPERTAWIGESQPRCGPRTCCAAFLRELFKTIENEEVGQVKIENFYLFLAASLAHYTHAGDHSRPRPKARPATPNFERSSFAQPHAAEAGLCARITI
jgi:hypothetical protein